MTICQYCNEQVSDTALRCQHCGTSLASTVIARSSRAQSLLEVKPPSLQIDNSVKQTAVPRESWTTNHSEKILNTQTDSVPIQTAGMRESRETNPLGKLSADNADRGIIPNPARRNISNATQSRDINLSKNVSSTQIDSPIIQNVGHPNIPDSLFAAFIGKKAPYYMSRFAKFMILGNNFAMSWNWAAFWVPYAWLFYRRMYLFGLIALIVSTILSFIGWLIAGVIMGLCGNYLYYSHAKNKLLGIQASTPENDRLLAAQALGGTNVLVVWVIVIFYIIVLFMIAAPFLALMGLALL